MGSDDDTVDVAQRVRRILGRNGPYFRCYSPSILGRGGPDATHADSQENHCVKAVTPRAAATRRTLLTAKAQVLPVEPPALYAFRMIGFPREKVSVCGSYWKSVGFK